MLSTQAKCPGPALPNSTQSPARFRAGELINEPTRITDSSSSLLDVCIVSSPENVLNTGVIHVGFSDHSLIYLIRKINTFPKTNTIREIEIRNYKHLNSENFLNDLRRQYWVLVNSKSDINAMWALWKKLFLEILNKHAPLRSKRIRNKPNLPWIPKDIRNKMFERDRLKRIAITSNEEDVWKTYKSYKNKVNIAFKKAKMNYYTSKMEKPKAKPKTGLEDYE